MNAGKHIYDLLIAERLKRWTDLVRTPLIDCKVPTSYARRQFRTLIRKHRLVAARYGFSEDSVIDAPRVLECELLPDAAGPARAPTGLGLSQRQSSGGPVASAPTQEFPIGSPNGDVTDPAERLVDQIAGCRPEPSASGVPRMSLDGEVL